MPTSTGTVATKPRKNGIFDNVDVTKRSLLFKCLRVARSHRENTAIPSTEGLSEGHCHNPLQNNGLENGYSRTRLPGPPTTPSKPGKPGWRLLSASAVCCAIVYDGPSDARRRG